MERAGAQFWRCRNAAANVPNRMMVANDFPRNCNLCIPDLMLFLATLHVVEIAIGGVCPSIARLDTGSLPTEG